MFIAWGEDIARTTHYECLGCQLSCRGESELCPIPKTWLWNGLGKGWGADRSIIYGVRLVFCLEWSSIQVTEQLLNKSLELQHVLEITTVAHSSHKCLPENCDIPTSSPDFGPVKKINHHPKREKWLQSWLTLRLIHDSLTTHSQLTHNSLMTHARLISESIMLYDFLYNSSLSQLCFMTSFMTHLWVNYALWLPLRLTIESIMFYDFLYDSPLSQLCFITPFTTHL